MEHLLEKAAEALLAEPPVREIARNNSLDRFVVWGAQKAMDALAENFDFDVEEERRWFEEVHRQSVTAVGVDTYVEHRKNPVIVGICKQVYDRISKERQDEEAD